MYYEGIKPIPVFDFRIKPELDAQQLCEIASFVTDFCTVDRRNVLYNVMADNRGEA